MVIYMGFSSENRNISIPKVTRSEVSLNKIDTMFTRKRNEENAKRAFNERGTGKFTKFGVDSRLRGDRYDESILMDVNESFVVTSGDVKSYYYGYYVRANEIIASKVVNSEVRSDIDIGTIGYNDAVNGVSFDMLPDKVKNCNDYLIGYKKGLEDKKKIR